MKRIVVVLSSLVLLGCGRLSQDRVASEPVPTFLFDDKTYKNERDIPPPEQIFHLSKNTRQKIQDAFSRRDPHQSVRAWLVTYAYELFAGFTWKNETRVAEETFRANDGNCLSLAILTSAIARQLQISHVFQAVIAPPTWDRENGITLVSRHVNLLVWEPVVERAPRESNQQVLYPGRRVTIIDFFPEAESYPSDLLMENQIVAMFYANLAARAVINRDFDHAYWLVRTSIDAYPTFGPSWDMLALVYAHTKNPLAPSTFYHTVHLEPDSMSTIHNFVVWLDHWGQTEEADIFRKRLQQIKKQNPFFFFDKAEIAYAEQKYRTALLLYQKAIAIDEFQHEFHFGLYKSYFALKKYDRAEKSLKQAITRAGSDRVSNQYLSKLEKLGIHW